MPKTQKVKTEKQTPTKSHTPVMLHRLPVPELLATKDFPKSPEGFILNAMSDIPDIRDRMYEPSLIQLKKKMDPPKGLNILNQGQEGACTGFGLAAVINLLNANRGNRTPVSSRMLYEMARKFDEWPGEAYSGSSCRGAIRGWHSMGVCRETLWPYKPADTSSLTVERAKDARNNTIGAYYRLRKDIVDYHVALNEVGVLYVSANVHTGWSKNAVQKGEIPFRDELIGGHAFAIVGYNHKGFWVQNSWGPNWGRGGVALWSYEDWLANIKDGWVVQMAFPTPQIFNLAPRQKAGGEIQEPEQISSPARAEIAGHFVHIQNGDLHDNGKYWSNVQDVIETATFVAKSTDYDHLMFYAHGGLNSVEDSARRISAMKEVFKANRIYPYHFMYDTGLLEEIKDVVLGKKSETHDRVAGIADWTDKFIEYTTRKPGRALWREMKSDAQVPFYNDRGGVQTVQAFLKQLEAPQAKKKSIHITGHSTGAILLAHFLQAFKNLAPAQPVQTCNLMAPAATVELFNSLYRPYLGVQNGNFGIANMAMYNLTDQQERDDQVAEIYRKSLLYLVSNAFEEIQGAAILGMQRFCQTVEQADPAVLKVMYSSGKEDGESPCASLTHGGFDNDPCTLNDILKRIVGKTTLDRPFTKEDLDY